MFSEGVSLAFGESQYLGMLELIEDYFCKAGIGVTRLQGDMSASAIARILGLMKTLCRKEATGGV